MRIMVPAVELDRFRPGPADPEMRRQPPGRRPTRAGRHRGADRSREGGGSRREGRRRSRRGGSPKFLAAPMALWRHQLRTQIADPELRAKCVPDYTMGCKRVVFSDDWYPALAGPDVELVTNPIERIAPDGVVTADGTTRAADVIVYGTGFKSLEFLAPMTVSGLGRTGACRRPGRRGRRPAFRDHGLRVPELLHALRAEHQPRRQLDHLHARRGGSGCVTGAIRALERTSASPGLTCGPTCRTRSTRGCSRPAGRRSGRAAATTGTRRPRGATSDNWPDHRVLRTGARPGRVPGSRSAGRAGGDHEGQQRLAESRS